MTATSGVRIFSHPSSRPVVVLPGLVPARPRNVFRCLGLPQRTDDYPSEIHDRHVSHPEVSRIRTGVMNVTNQRARQEIDCPTIRRVLISVDGLCELSRKKRDFAGCGQKGRCATNPSQRRYGGFAVAAGSGLNYQI